MNPLLLFFMIFILPTLVSALSPDLEKAFASYNQEPGAELIRRRVKEGLNSTNEAGFSPLIEASFNGYTGIVDALLREGADPTLKTKNGRTALTWAIKKGHDEVCALLLEALAPKYSEKVSLKKPLPKKSFRENVTNKTALGRFYLLHNAIKHILIGGKRPVRGGDDAFEGVNHRA